MKTNQLSINGTIERINFTKDGAKYAYVTIKSAQGNAKDNGTHNEFISLAEVMGKPLPADKVQGLAVGDAVEVLIPLGIQKVQLHNPQTNTWEDKKDAQGRPVYAPVYKDREVKFVKAQPNGNANGGNTNNSDAIWS